MNCQNLIRLQNMFIDIKLKNAFKQSITRFLCEFCKQNKIKTKFLRRFQNPVFKKNEYIDIDLSDTIFSSALKKYSYFVININKATNYS